MNGFRNWLKGKKSYFVMVITFVLGGLIACEVEVPPWVYPLLAACGLGAVRAAIAGEK